METHVQPDAILLLEDQTCIIFEHETAYGSRVRGLVAIQHSPDSISRGYELERGGGEGLYSTAFDPLFQLGISFEAL